MIYTKQFAILSSLILFLCLCVQVRSALNVVSQLCSQDSVSESPSLLRGVDMMSVIFTPAHYQQTTSAPTSHGLHLEML